jgi:hypothetical protein
MRNQTLVQRPRGRTMIAAAAALAAACPASAGAQDLGENRGPTARERAGIARAAKVPARCMEIDVSANHTQWASWAFRFPLKGSCRTYARRAVSQEALTFVRRSGSRWRTIAAVSDCGRPKRVPVSVYRDIGPVACLPQR